MTDTVSFGYQQVAPDEKTRRVGGVFSSVAARYDLMNDAMSGGMHRLWKDRFVARVKPRAGEAILDMAGGTGDIAFRLAKAGAAVTVADINPDMLAVGMDRARKRRVDGLIWTEQNAETLSFPDRQFDAYTIAFGIRNVTDIRRRLARSAPGAAARWSLFSASSSRRRSGQASPRCTMPIRTSVVPQLGQLLARDKDSYRYLVESIRRFPDMPAFEAMIRDAGFAQTRVEPIMGGLVAIHSGWKV